MIFEAGLWPNIRRALAAFPLVGYADVVMRSLAIEAKEVVLKRDREANTPTKSVQTSSSNNTGRSRSIKHTSHSFISEIAILSSEVFIPRFILVEGVIRGLLCLRP